eukprot:12487743-Alexandrium_andersonii.AAC.1
MRPTGALPSALSKYFTHFRRFISGCFRRGVVDAALRTDALLPSAGQGVSGRPLFACACSHCTR